MSGAGRLARVATAPVFAVSGPVQAVSGLVVRAVLPGAWIGELCEVTGARHSSRLLAQVVGFDGDEALLLPLGSVEGISSTSCVRRLDRPLTVGVGPLLCGRVVDGLGRPIDGGSPVTAEEERAADTAPPRPLTRRLTRRVFATGVRAIDALLTMGVGQRVGVFAPAGAGKSTLLGMIARHARADVVVVALVGERGREVREFLEVELEPATKSRCVAVVATSDEPVLLRRLAACVATTVAEYFRDRGADVLLLVDSITRHVRALRDVALAAGEPPGRGGFPPSVFSGLPGLLERTGQSEHGSITAIYSVLVDSLDLTDPVGDEVRAVLDGHIVLSREIAGRGTYPAIDISASTSRVMDRVVDGDHLAAARRLRSLIAAYERDRDLVMLGAYEQGADPLLDEAVARADEIAELLQQVPAESSQFRATRERLLELAVPLAATGGLSVQD